ncbi:HAMP domain-containing sensor histidine kinase [Nonomuraea sp. NPDC004580]|uniref:sensor histidine kinase n=1 Tax=Nonomuraea sp. NPDC004580 TaxID=3154552 RepID=UPI0033A07E68
MPHRPGPLALGLPRPGRLSVQARLVLVTALLSLASLTGVAGAVDLFVRDRIEREVYESTQRAATEWIGAMGTSTPQPVTTPEVSLFQLVDATGHVVQASREAEGRPPMSTLWPNSDDRIQHGKECTRDGCVMFTAYRPSPQEEELWGGASHIVYAGRPEPALLAGWDLELGLAAAVLTGTALLTGLAALLIRRTLRPVEEMRARIAEITVTDLGLRVPAPPGDDAIASLARTVNRTLARLQEAVSQQRHYSSMVSHELRTPLAGLRMRLEEAVTYPDADREETIRGALGGVDRLQRIIDEMLLLTRIRTSSPQQAERVDLGHLVREEAGSLPGPYRPLLVVHDSPRVWGNRTQLTEVLTNLLVNAQRHARSAIEVSVARKGDEAVLTVWDDGEGIAPEEREQVFQPFVRLAAGRKRDPAGSGLGLAISRAIAQAHEGDLTIEDGPRGTCFVLRLPLAGEHEPG